MARDDRSELHVGLFEKATKVVLTATTNANPTDDDPLTRRHGTIEPESRSRDNRGSSDGGSTRQASANKVAAARWM